jgi:putative oxidoreductase
MIATTAARVTIGALFAGHGVQKLFGWFGGPGIEGTKQMTQSLQLGPVTPNAYAVGLSEGLGGAMFAAGLATPLAASSLIGTMITAIRKVHLPNGPWVTSGGYEYNLVLIGAVAALTEIGPGRISLDHLLGTERSGWKWALGALALGAASSTAVIEAGKRQAAAAPAATEPAGVAAAAEADHAAEQATG